MSSRVCGTGVRNAPLSAKLFDSVSPPSYAASTLYSSRSLSGPLQGLSDTDGRFRFDSLPPGDYRILASFDVNEIDEELMETSHAVVVHAGASQTATIELPVWMAPW